MAANVSLGRKVYHLFLYNKNGPAVLVFESTAPLLFFFLGRGLVQ